MSQMIATQLATRVKLLKGDLPKMGEEMTTSRSPTGLPVPKVMLPRRPPPGLPILPQFGSGGMHLHQFVPQALHTGHEFIPPSIKSTFNRGNN